MELELDITLIQECEKYRTGATAHDFNQALYNYKSYYEDYTKAKNSNKQSFTIMHPNWDGHGAFYWTEKSLDRITYLNNKKLGFQRSEIILRNLLVKAKTQ